MSSFHKKNTKRKTAIDIYIEKKTLTLLEKQDLFDTINLAGPLDSNIKNSIYNLNRSH